MCGHGHKNSFAFLLVDLRKGTIEIRWGRGRRYWNSGQSHRLCRLAHQLKVRLVERRARAWSIQHSHAVRCRSEQMEKLNGLAKGGTCDGARPGRISSGARETADVTIADRINRAPHHDG